VQKIKTVSAFLNALMNCFTSPGLIPIVLPEQIQYCFNLSVLVDDFLDPQLARFDLDESTGDKVHHFIFRKHRTTGKVIMQYKLLRYSCALYPRKYMPSDTFSPHEAEKDAAVAFTTEDLGVGQVLSSKPF
jgi:hypothetical protein